MPQSPSWWTWTATAGLLAVGVSGRPEGFLAAIALSTVHTAVVAARERDLASYPVQIRVAYTACLIMYFAPSLRWLFWVPMLGTFALVLFGYCLMARLLSLMPWNRREPITLDFLRRTFLTPPVAGNVRHGLPAAGGDGGVCSLEARAAEFASSSPSSPSSTQNL